MEMLRSLAEVMGKMIVVISHDLNLAVKYAHKVIPMEPPGVLRGIGTPEEAVTEENVRDVYGIECDAIRYKGFPPVVLGSVCRRETQGEDGGK